MITQSKARPTAASVGGGAASTAPSDFIVQFSKVTGSSLSPDNPGTVLYNVSGIGGFDPTEGILLDDAQGEVDEGTEYFSSPGLLGRPLSPQDVANGRTEHMEVMCLRTVDGLVPFSYRDTRLKMVGNAPQEGVMAFVGYGGGFLSQSPIVERSDASDPNKITDILGTIQVLYCPYDFDADGVAQKAHSVILDPTAGNENISVVHAEGQALLMQADGSATLQSVDGQSFLQVTNASVTMQSPQIVLNGGAVVIGNPVGPIAPLTPGPASPPCPRLFLNPAA